MVEFPLLEDYYFLEIFGLRQAWIMDMHILISALSVMYSCILCAASALPAREAPTVSPPSPRERHVRTKRCSCATFLDKECVYFCHLDIIWVNTPERVVSYGLGNAPRAKRAVAYSMSTSSRSRCQCFQENDNKCRNFCRLEKHLGYGTLPDKVIRSVEGDACDEAQCKHKLAADTGRIKRMMNSNKKLVSPRASRAALKIRLLHEKWRTRQRHRARVWEGKSATS